MKKIGITGGIGSGKSTACEIFKLLGVSVFHADDEAKNLQNNNLQIKNYLIELFGEHLYSEDGLLDRKMLAGLIFNDTKALAKVNAIIHPAVRQNFLKWVENKQNDNYVLYEAAILLESGYSVDFDRNILILADEKIRIERVMKRDSISEELVKERIKNQMSDSEKINLVDYVLENSNDKLLIPQIIALDKVIREDCK
jgi:dephospho-CoA kinase